MDVSGVGKSCKNSLISSYVTFRYKLILLTIKGPVEIETSNIDRLYAFPPRRLPDQIDFCRQFLSSVTNQSLS